MTMKKILAGVLAAASMLTVSATAFAAPEAPDKTKAVTKAGETEYEAGISMMTAELDVELPAQMKAFINPYGAEVAIDAEATPTKSSDGIVSWAYEVVNNTTDFGIMIDVKKAKATPSTGVSLLTAAPGKTGAKKALVELKAGATAADVKYAAADTTSAAATATAQGKVLLTATDQDLARFAYAPAKDDTNGAGKVFIGIVGSLEKGDPTNATPVADPEWTEDDTITCAYTLKINPAKTTQAQAFA